MKHRIKVINKKTLKIIKDVITDSPTPRHFAEVISGGLVKDITVQIEELVNG